MLVAIAQPTMSAQCPHQILASSSCFQVVDEILWPLAKLGEQCPSDRWRRSSGALRLCSEWALLSAPTTVWRGA